MGYHMKEISKGKLGEFSKIEEEFLEFEDSINQSCILMAILELSDLLGAIEAYFLKENKESLFKTILKNTNSSKSQEGDVELLKNAFYITKESFEKKLLHHFSDFSTLLEEIENFVNDYNFTLNDLMVMKDITKRAFLSGKRNAG